MALLAATIIVLAAIAGVAIGLYAAILDIAGLVRGDLACQSQMQQRRYDDVVGLCERIEAILEADRNQVETEAELQAWLTKINTQALELILLHGSGRPKWFTQAMTAEVQKRREKQSESRDNQV